MKASLLRAAGTPLDVVDVTLAPLPPGHVRVRMAAAGVCHSDLSVQQGRIPFPLPAVLGHEGAGIVTDVGGDDDPVELVRELTDGVGVDHAFEVVGRPETIRQAFAMARRGGTAVLVGAGSPDDEVRFDAMELFVDAKRILGCVYGSADPERDFPRILDLHRAGRLALDELVGEHIELEDLPAAFSAMEAGRGGRAVVVFDGHAVST